MHESPETSGGEVEHEVMKLLELFQDLVAEALKFRRSGTTAFPRHLKLSDVI